LVNYESQARTVAKRYGINPDVFVALVRQESGGNAGARSGAGAIGLTQLMPATAKSLGVNADDPIQNLEGGAKYLKEQLDRFGDYRKALAAYNAGPGAVSKYGGVPPYAETQNYVKRILGNKSPTLGSSPAASSTTTTTVTPGVDNKKARGLAFLDYLGNEQARHSDTGFLDLASTLKSLKDVPAVTKTASSGGASSSTETSKTAGRRPVVVAPGAERPGIGLQKPILSFLHELAGASGRQVDVTTGTNHNRMTTSGNVSDHWSGNAADLGVGADARQDGAAGHKGDLIAAHAIALAGGVSFDKALAMARKGGVFNFETKAGRVQILWRTLTGGNHYNHVHVGLNPSR
jgi:hypothetical protein